jgi:hypothetical protein
MLISELTAALGKVSQITGDVPISLVAADGGAATEIDYLDVHVVPGGDLTASSVLLYHGAPAAAPAAADAANPPAAPSV